MARGPKKNVPRGVFMCNSEAHNTFTNSAYQNMLGCGPEELLGLKWVDYIHPDDFQEVWDQAFSLREAGGLNIEFRLRTKVGWRWVNCQSVDMPDSFGQGSYVGIIEDITWRKEAEESLRLSEERFALAVRGSNDGLWDWDIRSNKVFYSQRYKNMLGIDLNSEGNDTPEVFESRLHPNYKDVVLIALKEYLAVNKPDGSPFHIEALMQTGVEKYCWFQLRGQALWDEQGNAVRIAGSLSDISERIRWEEEQDRLIASLAEARDKAEAAAQHRSDFLAVMSHEIRTPLNAVIGMASALLDTNPTPDQVECFETIRTSGESVLSILNDVLDVSKVDAGKLIIVPVACDLRNLVEDVGNMLVFRVEPKGVELVVRYETPFAAVFADEKRLRQILSNLIGNACKFTHVGHVLVDVCLVCPACKTRLGASTRWECPACYVQEDRRNVKHWKFSIIDSGIGIATDKLGLLFEKFSQCDLTTSSMYGGTGLGLALSKSLVELMGGTVSVVSEEGKGSTFSFTLPLELDIMTERSCQKPELSTSIKQRAPPSVHIIDNHEMTTKVLREQLCGLGFACSWSRDPSALERLKYSEFDTVDVVIIDHVLAEKIQLSRNLNRLTELFNGKPLVLLKPFGRQYSQDALTRAGFCVAISRPVRQSLLIAALSKAFAQLGLKLFDHNFSATGVQAPVSSGTSPGLRESGKIKNPRILVVEDNKVNQMVAIRLLKNLGCTVDIASNGEEAVSMTDEQLSYDLIFMDCHMPVLDGFQAAQLIRHRQEQRKRTPIVALTASTIELELEKCLQSGMDDFVRKPCTKFELQRALKKWLPDSNESEYPRQ